MLVENGTTILKFMLHISRTNSDRAFRRGWTIPGSAGSSARATSLTGCCGTSSRAPTRSRSRAAPRHGRLGT
jgi:hypothetical protein